MSEKHYKQPQLSLIYNVQRAIDHIQQRTDIVPIRFFSVLFPLWSVEVQGEQKEPGAYRLIENYVERGILHGGLQSTRELADFFGLDQALVTKVVAFLSAIGHVAGPENRLHLTPLGIESQQDMQKYVLLETRRLLYFDGFLLKSLLQEHYESRSMRFLSDQETWLLPERDRGQRFLRLNSSAWNIQAIEELNRIPDKARYNIPDEVTNLQQISLTKTYTPMYIFETRRRTQQSRLDQRYLTYTGIQDILDPFFEEIINASPNILQPLYAEEEKNPARLWSDYVADRGLPPERLRQLENGSWQLSLLPNNLTQKVRMALGSYWIERGYFLHIWCNSALISKIAT
jgi:hypothetical protein